MCTAPKAYMADGLHARHICVPCQDCNSNWFPENLALPKAGPMPGNKAEFTTSASSCGPGRCFLPTFAAAVLPQRACLLTQEAQWQKLRCTYLDMCTPLAASHQSPAQASCHPARRCSIAGSVDSARAPLRLLRRCQLATEKRRRAPRGARRYMQSGAFRPPPSMSPGHIQGFDQNLMVGTASCVR